MAERGKYVVIEGHDGTGKSTQVRLLRERLAADGIESVEFHEPEGTPIANEIRAIIKNGTLPRDAKTNLLLFTAARHEIWQQAKKELAGGKWVIAARNYYSTLAYQGYGEGLELNVITETTRRFTDERYMRPDQAIILSLEDYKERERRIHERGKLTHADTFESKDGTFQQRVGNGYLRVAAEYKLPVIAADVPAHEVHEQIYQLIR